MIWPVATLVDEGDFLVPFVVFFIAVCTSAMAVALPKGNARIGK